MRIGRIKIVRLPLLIVLVALASAGCASLGGLFGGMQQGDRFYGVASWYGSDFHGRKTANGESYNMNGHTAAHRTLPFGTVLRITNMRNGLQTTVRINALNGSPGSPFWQRNYYEHIIRDESELQKIWDYIQMNPLHWNEDQLHPIAVL